MRECRGSEYFEFSGIENVPETMARGCSPNGVVKKHNLYSRQPRAYRSGENIYMYTYIYMYIHVYIYMYIHVYTQQRHKYM